MRASRRLCRWQAVAIVTATICALGAWTRPADRFVCERRHYGALRARDAAALVPLPLRLDYRRIVATERPGGIPAFLAELLVATPALDDFARGDALLIRGLFARAS